MNNETEVDTIKTIEYSSANEIRFSDHRPVSGLYAVTIKYACDEKRSNQIREELNRMSDRFENEAIPTIDVHPRPPEIKFTNVRYLDKPSYPLTIKNTGECVCSCTIQPSSLSPSFQYVICSPAPPYVIDVKGEQHVNISFNARLRKESISEILILHVENGADKFITLDITFDNGPFGLALNEYPPTFYDNDTKKYIYSIEKPATSEHIVEMINDPPILYIALIETLKDRSDLNMLQIFSNETQDSLDVIPIRDQIYEHHYDFSKYSTAEIFMIFVHLLQSLKDPLISFEIQDKIFSNSAQLNDSSRAVSILVEQLKGKERNLFFRLLVLLKNYWPTKEQIEKTDDEAGDAFNMCIDILALSIFHEHLDRTQRHACILACLNEEKKP
ncbi:unnamed protein product [Adineta ricciae]|nr:unnamed protein product [Adineta ricciae]